MIKNMKKLVILTQQLQYNWLKWVLYHQKNNVIILILHTLKKQFVTFYNKISYLYQMNGMIMNINNKIINLNHNMLMMLSMV